MPIFGSPKHFVVYHALLRLWVPRYPPQAFCRLNLVVECCATSTCYYMRCRDFINVHRELVVGRSDPFIGKSRFFRTSVCDSIDLDHRLEISGLEPLASATG
jgi:hypothetical protein